MGYHTFDSSRANKLEQAGWRYRFLSAEELLWALDVSPDDGVADLGNGTGFFTDDVAPYAGDVHAVDVQEEMHNYYRKNGVPKNVDLVTNDVSDLPFDDDALAEVRRFSRPAANSSSQTGRRPEPARTGRRSTNDTAPTRPRTPSATPGSASNTRPSDRRPSC